MLLHKSLKENIKPACSISYVIVESDGGPNGTKRGMMAVWIIERMVNANQ
jgi:hypothetical protein